MDQSGPFELEFFRNNGFTRKKCVSCSSFFWTTDHDRTTCGDSPCDQYSFIGNSPCPEKHDTDSMRKLFISFFSETHKVVKNYPVVPRWRDDVLLVNASIYDFQPHVTMGYAKPPGNPIVMSQPCIRMIDLDLVGKTGRHLTSFEMMCNDAFNYPDEKIYWKDGTVEYCNSFLVQALRIGQELITYKENPWAGGGNAGNALEVLVSGLEVATLVFMDLIESPDGEVQIEGIRYTKMPIQVVDTGYGLERLVWLSVGTPTIYEAIYPELLEFLRSSIPESRRSAINMKDLYILADHSRSLLLMLSDSVIPSNVKVGYLARMLIRRCMRVIESSGLETDLLSLVRKQHEKYSSMLLQYSDSFVETILAMETEKYRNSVRNGESAVEKIFRKKKGLDANDLMLLYDSHGLTPDFVQSLAAYRFGFEVEIPDNFHSKIVSMHSPASAERKKKIGFPALETRPLYYDDTSIKDFTALVLHSGEGFVILNQTAFYPEGGGQPCDLGYIKYGSREIQVRKVEKYGKTIVHFIDGSIPDKARVHGFIDYSRRRQLMIHHSGTHLILGVMREVLGDHVWQSGVQKEIDYSRIDITHYSKLSDSDIREIENRCLEIISQKRTIRVMNIEWNKAIDKYGFRLFQGGVPLDSKVRVVEIEGVDVEGCGGTHLNHTSEINVIKIISTETIQEGIQRVIFAAGPAALRNHQNVLEISRKMQDVVHSRVEDLPGRMLGIIEGAAEQKKEIAKLKNILLDGYISESSHNLYQSHDVLFNTEILPPEVQELFIPRILGMKGGIGIARTGEREYMVVSSGIPATGLCQKLAGNEKAKITGNDRIARITVAAENGEKLIKRLLA